MSTHKRPQGHEFSAESLSLDFCDGVYSSSCSKRRKPQIIQQKISPTPSSLSCVHFKSVAIFTGKEDKGMASYSSSHGSLASVSSSASALTDVVDSSALDFSLPHDCTQEERCCASSNEGVESCCEGDDATSELDIAGFLLHEGWDEYAGCEGGDELAFSPEAIYLNGGPSTEFCEEAAFAGCSAEHGDWFLNELDGEGHAYLDEVLDQEWMAAAMANLDRINDTLDADWCRGTSSRIGLPDVVPMKAAAEALRNGSLVSARLTHG